MITSHTRTFCLISENESEYQQWSDILAPHCWAEGEFGMIVTEAAFQKIMKESVEDACITHATRKLMLAIAEAVEAGDYTDVCLQQTAASTNLTK